MRSIAKNYSKVLTPAKRFSTSALAFNPHEDISEHVKTVSKLSGSGPFADLPTFQLLGSPFPSAIHVSLPSSAKLYLKNGAAVLGVTGTVTKPTSTLKYSNAANNAPSLPLVYQKVTSTSALTLLLSAPTRSRKASWYALIEPSKSYNWVVRRDALLAWGGHQLNLTPITSALHKTLSAFRESPIYVQGDGGQLALTNETLIYEFKVKAGEDVFLRQGSILGLTVPKDQQESSGSLLEGMKSVYRVQHLPLAATLQEIMPGPLQGVPDTFRTWGAKLNITLPASVSRTFEVVGTYWDRAFSVVRDAVSAYLWQDDVLVKISGPATVLVDHTPPSLIANKLGSSN